MGSDLAMTPPAAPLWRLVTAENYVALYKRETDGVYSDAERNNWTRVYLTTDDQEQVSNGMGLVLSIFARGRYKEIRRDDLCVQSAAEPFLESYPREVLEDDDLLQRQRAEILRELAKVDQQIEERKKTS